MQRESEDKIKSNSDLFIKDLKRTLEMMFVACNLTKSEVAKGIGWEPRVLYHKLSTNALTYSDVCSIADYCGADFILKYVFPDGKSITADFSRTPEGRLSIGMQHVVIFGEGIGAETHGTLLFRDTEDSPSRCGVRCLNFSSLTLPRS